MNLSVFGLGKIGTTLAACLGAAGHNVIGVDVVAEPVEALAKGISLVDEVGVPERLLASSSRVSATLDVREAVRGSSISFIIVPTPSNALGGFSNAYVLRACEQIGREIGSKDDSHLVAVVSTMLPGSSDYSIMPMLEKASGRKIGDGLGYCYNPAFIALGEVVRGFETPDFALIGESDKASGDILLEALAPIIKNGAPHARMTPMEAEIAKIASNTHETMRVTFANMLLGICSELPGTNVDRITEALTHRMGRRFFKGAVPYGGPCWPRDNRALSVFMEAIGAPGRLPRNVDLSNSEHGTYVLRKILEVVPPGEDVSVLGLAYKPGTAMTEQAFGIDLIRNLVREGRKVIAWDPLAIDEAKQTLGSSVEFAPSMMDAIRAATYCVLVNPLPAFTDFDWSAARHATIIDCWRALSAVQSQAVGVYRPLGRGPDTSVRQWISSSIGPRFELLTN